MTDPLELVTFRAPDNWWLNQLRDAEARVFNGVVSVVRYRITIEAIEEPEEIEARLRKLWAECQNSHHYGPLREEAKRRGIELRSRL